MRLYDKMGLDSRPTLSRFLGRLVPDEFMTWRMDNPRFAEELLRKENHVLITHDHDPGDEDADDRGGDVIRRVFGRKDL